MYILFTLSESHCCNGDRADLLILACTHTLFCRCPIDCDIQYLCGYDFMPLSSMSFVNYHKNCVGDVSLVENALEDWIYIIFCNMPCDIEMH